MSIKINGIRKIKNEDVYCLTVEDDESYIVDNIILNPNLELHSLLHILSP